MYRIEITADTLAELGGKVLSLAAQLNSFAAKQPLPAAELVAKAAKGTTTATVVQVALEPVAPASEPVAELPKISELPPAPVAEEPKVVELKPAPKVGEPTEDFDFAKEITPRVVAVVTKCGRGKMGEILEQFGVAKASHVPPEQREELIRLLDDAAA